MTIKAKLINLLPRHLELAARYHYNSILGRLEREMGVIGDIVQTRRRCLDVGANVGLYTYRFAQLFNAVDAFEPIPRCARIIVDSRLKNVRVHHLALSSRPGEAMLSIPGTGGPEATALASLSNQFVNAESLTVKLRTLDSYKFAEVDLIKIDVEGHELDVLAGATETIKQQRPTLLIEIEQRHHGDRSIQDIFNVILNMGYEGSFLWNGRMAPLADFSVERYQQSYDPQRRADYVNNFIFRRA